MPRSKASVRTAANNRIKVLDIKSSLSFNGTSSVISTGITPSPTGWCFAAWLKPQKVGTATYHYISCNTAAFTDGFALIRGATASDISLNIYSGGSAIYIGSGYNAGANDWVHIVQTYLPNGICNTYYNGVLYKTQTVAGTMGATPSNTVTIGKRSYANSYSGLSLNNFVWENTTTSWTQEQVTKLYTTGTPPSTANVYYKLDEGAGTTAYDSSGNGNHSTITSGTFTSDVPTKKRGVVGGNLVYNGDFEYAPPFTAATTTSTRYIDGTAAGSTTNSLFKWAAVASNDFSASYDSVIKRSGKYSLKLSTTSIAGVAIAHTALSTASPTVPELIPVTPGVSYILSGYIKTNNVASSAAWLDLRWYSGARVSLVTYNTAKLSGTNDWTYVSVTQTATADARYATILCRNGVAGNISDAWFDDITLTPTTPVTRGVVS